jgi:hypothetical protein
MTHVVWDHVTRDDVVRAIREYGRLAPEGFFAEHGFGPTTTYDLVWDEHFYPPKAILGAAYELADVLGKELARPQVERDACPAPVVDLEPQRGEGLGRRTGAHPRHGQVPVVLAADVVVRVHRGNGPEHLDPLVPQPLRIGCTRRLGREQPDELEQVVLHDVAERPDGVVEAAPVLHAEVFGHGDLHALHPVAIPQRLEDGVAEPEEQDVQGRLLAEKVVNPEDLPFVQEPVQVGVERPG